MPVKLNNPCGDLSYTATKGVPVFAKLFCIGIDEIASFIFSGFLITV